MTGGLVVSSPTIFNNVIYIGSYDKNVYALNSADGSLKWSFLTDKSIWASPTLSNGVIYVGSSDFKFYSLNYESGNKIWEFKTESQIWSSACVISKKGKVSYSGISSYN